jgi:hypothetical protein
LARGISGSVCRRRGGGHGSKDCGTLKGSKDCGTVNSSKDCGTLMSQRDVVFDPTTMLRPAHRDVVFAPTTMLGPAHHNVALGPTTMLRSKTRGYSFSYRFTRDMGAPVLHGIGAHMSAVKDEQLRACRQGVPKPGQPEDR